MTEIRLALSAKNDLWGVYGFGSFFRGGEYNDIDILLVSTRDANSPLSTYKSCRETLKQLSKKWNVEIDITFLTYGEHIQKPLREHDSLFEIWRLET